MVCNKNQGYAVETYVSEQFSKQGFKVTFNRENQDFRYYDLKVVRKNCTRIEIKSCNLMIRNGGNRQYYGRFDFTNLKNSSRQRTKNVHICFVVCIGDEYEIIGFRSAKSVKKLFTSKRYLSLNKIMNINLSRFDNFIKNR